MEMIDKQGKLFGKINLIDFCVILFVLFIIGMGTTAWWRFIHFKENVIPPTQQQIDDKKTEDYFQKIQKAVDKAKLIEEYLLYQKKLKNSSYYDIIFKE